MRGGEWWNVDYLGGEVVLDDCKISRTACGRNHVLERRATIYKRGGGIARE